jgi:hypothetical protein
MGFTAGFDFLGGKYSRENFVNSFLRVKMMKTMLNPSPSLKIRTSKIGHVKQKPN